MVFQNYDVYWTTANQYSLLISDTVAMSDSPSRSFSKPISDVVTLFDVKKLNYSFHKSDSITTSDSFSRAITFSRTFSDSISLTDIASINKGGNKYLSFSDGFTVSDIVSSMANSKAVSDTVDFSDSVSNNDSKSFSDNVVFSESYSPTYVLIVYNHTVEFSVTNSNINAYVTPSIGGITGTPVYGNGYFTETFVIQSSTPALSFSGTGVSIATVNIENTYGEQAYSLPAQQTELNPIWQNLLILYTVFSGLTKDKRYNQSRAVESIYRAELPYLKQIIEAKPDSKSDMVYK